MNNFNKTRFLNFGKYDLIINKSFYRNMLLTTLFGCLGIALMGFFFRWNMCRDYLVPNQGYLLSDWTTPENVTVTSTFIFVFCIIMMVIFAGFTFHNLRTKQGRITELTIPATNIERWTWHVLLSFFGGLVLCIASILVSDIVNEILNLLVYQGHFNSSLTAQICRMMTFTQAESQDMSVHFKSVSTAVNKVGIRGVMIFLIISSFICQISCFVFGNSIKYHYNIILTYIALQVIGFIFSIIIMTLGATAANFSDIPNMSDDEVLTLIRWSFFILGIVLDAVAVLLYWGSYHNYCNAQITSHLNP